MSISNAKDVGVDTNTTPAGLATKPFCITTSTTKSYSTVKSVAYKTNQSKVYGTVVDKAGNATTKTVSITNIDKLAPGAPTVKLSTTDWTNQNVTATVRATDAAATSAYGKSGVVFYGYSLTGAKPTGWQTVDQADSATTFTLKNGGTYHFYAKDRAGNISAPTTVQVKIDKSGPEFSVIASADKTQLLVEVSKSTSGIAGYSFDGGTTWDYTNKTEFTKTYDQPQNTWRVLVKDNAGNIADSNGFSSDPPVIYRDGDLVALYGSGDLQYKIDNGEWLTYTGPFSVDHTKQTTIRAAYKNQTSHSVQLVLPADYNAQMAPVHSATDATITYGNAQFDLSRTYMPADGVWFWSTDSRLETVADGVLSVTLPDGSQTAFTRSTQSNIYTNALTDQTVAVYDTDGVVTYALSADDQTYTYNAAGLLVAISDDAGHSISITRTESRLQLSYGSGNDTLSYTFVLQNDLVQNLILPDGTKLVYTYKDGALSLVNEDSNTLAVQRNDQQPLGQYAYDSAKRIIKENGVTYTYDEQGRLTAETGTDGNTVTYTYDGTTVTTTGADGKNYRFIYDESGKPTAFLMNGALYHYITNQMGDVVGVTDAEGNLALEYFYDAWGDNFTRAIDQCDFDGEKGGLGAYKLSNANPLTYRGYYFDHAIGMYYLQSRYMNPVVNRFFNADDPDIARESKDIPVGMNLFAYCNNDPVNGVDPTGYKYSPSKAKAYAEKWWDSDKVGYNHAFGRETNGDCTNFVSACLYAGKLSIMTGVGRKGWHCHSYTDLKKNRRRPTIYQRSHAWAAAQNLYDWLHAKKLVNYTYVLKNRSDVDNVGRILISKPICAAVIFFTNSGKGNKNHTAISGQVIRKNYSFDVFYYAHSVPRNGKKGNKHSLKDYLRDHKGSMIHVCILV